MLSGHETSLKRRLQHVRTKKRGAEPSGTSKTQAMKKPETIKVSGVETRVQGLWTWCGRLAVYEGVGSRFKIWDLKTMQDDYSSYMTAVVGFHCQLSIFFSHQ